MPPRSVAQLMDDPPHRAPLDGATGVGEAEVGGIVRIGVWLDDDGRVVRARFRATSCAALTAYAEAACALAEETCASPDAVRIRAAVTGAHPVHHDRAEAVALAFARALGNSHSPAAGRGRSPGAAHGHPVGAAHGHPVGAAHGHPVGAEQGRPPRAEQERA